MSKLNKQTWKFKKVGAFFERFFKNGNYFIGIFKNQFFVEIFKLENI